LTLVQRRPPAVPGGGASALPIELNYP
jgi:hypothetical protein